jgi:preprotein translocase subunit SecE
MADQEIKKTDKKPSVFGRFGKWYRELKGEVKKIVWPSKEQTVNNTAVVMGCCLVVGAFVWIVDAILNLGITGLIGLF